MVEGLGFRVDGLGLTEDCCVGDEDYLSSLASPRTSPEAM